MGRCKDCAFWKPSKHSCCGECACEKFVDRSDNYGLPEPAQDKLCYSDDDGWQAHFGTGPEFGCVHFKEKT